MHRLPQTKEKCVIDNWKGIKYIDRYIGNSEDGEIHIYVPLMAPFNLFLCLHLRTCFICCTCDLRILLIGLYLLFYILVALWHVPHLLRALFFTSNLSLIFFKVWKWQTLKRWSTGIPLRQLGNRHGFNSWGKGLQHVTWGLPLLIQSPNVKYPDMVIVLPAYLQYLSCELQTEWVLCCVGPAVYLEQEKDKSVTHINKIGTYLIQNKTWRQLWNLTLKCKSWNSFTQVDRYVGKWPSNMNK